MGSSIRLFFVVGGVFGALAAVMAGLITWIELQHHRLPRRRVLGEVARIALIVLVVFVLASLVAGVVLLRLFQFHLGR